MLIDVENILYLFGKDAWDYNFNNIFGNPDFPWIRLPYIRIER